MAPCRRKLVRVKKVVEAVKKRISRNPRRSRISPVLVPPQSRQVSGSSCMPRAEISEFVHVVVNGIHFHVIPWNFERLYILPFFKTFFFRWVNLHGAPCTCTTLCVMSVNIYVKLCVTGPLTGNDDLCGRAVDLAVDEGWTGVAAAVSHLHAVYDHWAVRPGVGIAHPEPVLTEERLKQWGVRRLATIRARHQHSTFSTGPNATPGRSLCKKVFRSPIAETALGLPFLIFLWLTEITLYFTDLSSRFTETIASLLFLTTSLFYLISKSIIPTLWYSLEHRNHHLFPQTLLKFRLPFCVDKFPAHSTELSST